MKIVYLSVATWPSFTAHTAYVCNLCAEIAELGVDLEVVFCGPGTSAAGSTFGLEHSRAKVSRWPVVRSSAAARCYSQALNAVVHGRWPEDTLLITHNPAVLLGLSFRKWRLIFDCHSLDPRGRALKLALRRGRVAGVSFLSEALAAGFRGQHGEKAGTSQIARMAVRKDIFAPASGTPLARSPAGYWTIGYAGSMGADRGLDLVLQAIARAKSRGRRWCGLFVGGKPAEVAHWTNEARRAGLDANEAIFTGFAWQEDAWRTVAAADVLCAPYTTRTSTALVMSPMKLFEYLALGRPIVVSDFPSVREIVSHEQNALLVQPDSAAALEDALQRLENNPALGRTLATAARREASNHTWDCRARTWTAWLQSIASRPT